MARLVRTLSELTNGRSNKLILASPSPSTSSSASTSNDPDQDKVQNQELVIAEIDNGLQNLSIVEVKPRKICKQSTFSFITSEVIHTVESTQSIEDTYITLNLLNEKVLDKCHAPPWVVTGA